MMFVVSRSSWSWCHIIARVMKQLGGMTLYDAVNLSGCTMGMKDPLKASIVPYLSETTCHTRIGGHSI